MLVGGETAWTNGKPESSGMTDRVPTEADRAIEECLGGNRSFALIAGAGSGKTTSLIAALENIRLRHGKKLRTNGQRVACLTFTNRAVDVIRSRLGFAELFEISTLHSFLWGEIGRFQADLREAIHCFRIPVLLQKAREKDTGKATDEARRARNQVVRLETALSAVAQVPQFAYDNSTFSDYVAGRLSHDDVIVLAGHLLANRPNFRRVLGFRYPYIFVDEAQDTYSEIVAGLNLTCEKDGLPLVGYFGDPWQQIYEGRAGNFVPPAGGRTITKVENFRSAPQVIAFLNAFRSDVQQVPAGKNQGLAGSVEIRLVKAEAPQGERKRYSETQLERALLLLDSAVKDWGWAGKTDVVHLFLVRQMIARRLGFAALNQLFTGQYASAGTQEKYESGEHYLLQPFLTAICPLVSANRLGESRKAIDILRSHSPAYSTAGPNANRTLKEMIGRSKEDLEALAKIWASGTTREILVYCRDQYLIRISERMAELLRRKPRSEEYDETIHGEEKSDWLADKFLDMPTAELQAYCEFMADNTVYSTQHGVKGEEYQNVVVVFDDVEAGWSNYSFSKLLTPKIAGEPTSGQLTRGRNLAYVCFSRAIENLRIVLFTPEPAKAKQELVERLHLGSEQVILAG